MTVDRRKNARIRISVEVSITSGSNFYAGRTRDISESGVFVETSVALPVGAVIDLELTLAGSRHAVRGEVAWVLGAVDGAIEGVGVQLVDPCPRTRAAIAHFMARRAPVPFEVEAAAAPA